MLASTLNKIGTRGSHVVDAHAEKGREALGIETAAGRESIDDFDDPRAFRSAALFPLPNMGLELCTKSEAHRCAENPTPGDLISEWEIGVVTA